MVVQVGDKVLVYGAGTPWAFAKKIDPVEVGDKVDVVTLSDGTKLAMPKIELGLSEYVWVIPEWDTPFNLGDLPFNWGLIPLGAAVFTVTGVTCNTVEDSLRDWEPGELWGKLLILVSGTNNGRYYKILSNSAHAITVTNFDAGPLTTDGWYRYDIWQPGCITNLDESFTGGAIHASYVCRCISGLYYRYVFPTPILDNFPENNPQCIVDTIRIHLNIQTTNPPHSEFANISLWLRSGSTTISIPLTYTTDPIWANPPDTYDIQIPSRSVKNYDEMGFDVTWYTGIPNDIQIGPFLFRPPDCPTRGIREGDKYVIYDPITKRLVFNDATKSLTASNWQTGGEGAEISSNPIEYVWDGQGYVYLTSSKTTFSTIQFDDLLQVQAVHGETVRTIPSHLGERIAVSGETVSRELTNITSILRSGKNTITLTAKNQDGTKVGFVTAVYVKRNMTAVSL